jgi:hypothetical protein
MNVIADTWRGLVQRRLWPLAVLLVAALAAVPFLLAKKPASAATADVPVAQAAAKGDDASSSFVTLDAASEDGTVKRRRVLGIAKDPFAPAPPPKKKNNKSAKKAEATPTAVPAPSGGSQAPPSSPPAGPVPTATPGTTVPKGSIKVNFGTVDSDLAELTLAKLEPLPSDDDPVLVFEGLEGSKAVFSVPGLVTGQGDGTCDPDPSNCSTVKLHAGDTEFITITDADDNKQTQYQLELLKVYTHKTVVAETGSANPSS